MHSYELRATNTQATPTKPFVSIHIHIAFTSSFVPCMYQTHFWLFLHTNPSVSTGGSVYQGVQKKVHPESGVTGWLAMLSARKTCLSGLSLSFDCHLPPPPSSSCSCLLLSCLSCPVLWYDVLCFLELSCVVSFFLVLSCVILCWIE